MTTALVTHEPTPSGIITTPQSFKGSLENWRQHHYHVLTPAAAFTALPPQWGLLPVKVEINTDEQGGEVYSDRLFCNGSEVCLSKIGLTKIAQAAGMSIKTERMDNRTIPNYWEVRATVRIVGLDGTPQEWSATEELDLRDGSERSKKVLGSKNATGALTAARAKGMRNCEARAINAAIRLYGVKQKYSTEELRRPFIVVRMLFQPDMSNPTQAAIATQQALGGVSQLYPSAPLASLPPAGPEVLDVIDGMKTPTPPENLGTAAPQAAVPKGQRVAQVEIDLEAGIHTVTLEGAAPLLTDRSEIAKAAQVAKRTGQLVIAVTESRADGTYLVELDVVSQAAIAPATAAPTAAGTPADKRPIGGRRVVNVQTKEMKARATGNAFTLGTISFDSGETATTTDGRLITLAQQLQRSGVWVRATLEDSARYQGQLDLKGLSVIDPNERELPLDDDGGY